MIRTLAIVAIALCYLANTVQIYDAESGGYNVYFGNFGYHISKED